ncbi:MAG: 2-phospho-L-lactate transferase [Ilumatobacteraceae bacterium]
MIMVLAGGVGAARMLRALLEVVPATDLVAVVNTADDTVMHGLSISPDIDTITYTLAGAIDDERGWGLRDETWRAMEALTRFVPVRPSGSVAAPTWFNLGDTDLATHFYRTARLQEGATLTEVTAEIVRAFGLDVRLLPMSDDRVETRVTLAEPPAGTVVDPTVGPPTGSVEISFQEYFVQRHHAVAISAIRFAGARDARLTTDAASAMNGADAVIVAPSNPLVSIGPVRALAGVDATLSARRETVVAVSPIIGGVALKGPADRMLAELGHEPSVVGVARLYAPIAASLIIDPADEHLADAVRAAGMEPVVVPSIMSSRAASARLARAALSAAGVTID